VTVAGRALARWSPTAALLVALLAGPATAHAQASCVAAEVTPITRTRAWPSPLDRPVSLSVRDVSLRDALARVSAAARVRLSYSADLLPLDRRVCASPRSVPLGDALSALLRGTSVEPVVSEADHVVLVPRGDPSLPAADSATWRGVTVLDRVVVTGSPAGTPQRPLSTALDVVTGEQLRERGATTLAQALNAAVPGMWIWSQSPSSLLTRYGSVRGASSFGLTYPKVYIDGVEVANPRLVSRLNPETIERVEVIRGPQGAALYGADAISGVVNIITRHESVDSGSPLIRLHSGVGAARSDFVPNAAVAQDHGLSLRTGSVSRSIGVDMAAGSTGAFIPDAFSRRFQGSANARVVGERTITTLTSRYDAERAGSAVSPLLKSLLDESRAAGTTPGSVSPATQSVQQYTLGLSSSFAPSDRWTHSLVVGIDGDRINGVPDDDLPLPFAADSSQQLSSGAAIRGTMRASSVGRFVLSDEVSGTVAFSAEHTTLRQTSLNGAAPSVSWSGAMVPPGASVVDWQRNTGAVAQGSLALRSVLYLSGGMRLERNSLVGGSSQISVLPTWGATMVLGDEDLTLKLRTAYGKGIRPARTAVRQASWASSRGQLRSLALAPEEQRGLESGVDLIVGRRMTFQATRFDQLATGLIQRVAVGQSGGTGDPPAGAEPPATGAGDSAPHAAARRHIIYALQNVGEISNSGWELQGSGEVGPLSLSASLSIVDSRVRRVGSLYTGDLRAGDRMLGVPARSGSATAAWTATSWSASLTAYRASSWVNYDRLGIATAAAADNTPANGLMGPQLRSFWRTYEGNTHLGASASRDLTRRVSVLLAADNLLDQQSGEPDDITIVPGRTLTVGLRAAF
jgi:outer membrane receptor protein involved in Fe transport